MPRNRTLLCSKVCDRVGNGKIEPGAHFYFQPCLFSSVRSVSHLLLERRGAKDNHLTTGRPSGGPINRSSFSYTMNNEAKLAPLQDALNQALASPGRAGGGCGVPAHTPHNQWARCIPRNEQRSAPPKFSTAFRPSLSKELLEHRTRPEPYPSRSCGSIYCVRVSEGGIQIGFLRLD